MSVKEKISNFTSEFKLKTILLENKIINYKSLETAIKEIYKDILTKEPKFNKNSGFNKVKTDTTENDSNKLFTAKGALTLFNTISTNITNAIDKVKEVLRIDIAKKLDKGTYPGNASGLKTEIDGKSPTNHGHNVVTDTANGFMDFRSYLKLKKIAENANNYSLPTATSSVLGGVKIGSGISLNNGVISVTGYSHPATPGYNHIPIGGTTNNYLKWQSNGVAIWSNIDYSHITTGPNGRFVTDKKIKEWDEKITNNGGDFLNEITVKNNKVWHDGNASISKSSNGYCKLPNGMLMQWGIYNGKISHGQRITIQFPTTFTSIPQVVTQMGFQKDIIFVRNPPLSSIYSINTSNFLIDCGYYNGGIHLSGFTWIAVGY